MQQGELIASIPRKFVMSYERTMTSTKLGEFCSFFLLPSFPLSSFIHVFAHKIGKVAQGDVLLRSLPSLVLAVHVALERREKGSFFRPYLDVLPTSFSIPLFFKFPELVALKGSPVLGSSLPFFLSHFMSTNLGHFSSTEEALKVLFNTSRQYLYVQRLLKV